ncbi:MAG: hypothetical protein H6618_10460, partial [Deltaproteobacteria bacterium]|nr:hypothetical protein [Deltaproteobacteria bacterium]
MKRCFFRQISFFLVFTFFLSSGLKAESVPAFSPKHPDTEAVSELKKTLQNLYPDPSLPPDAAFQYVRDVLAKDLSQEGRFHYRLALVELRKLLDCHKKAVREQYPFHENKGRSSVERAKKILDGSDFQLLSDVPLGHGANGIVFRVRRMSDSKDFALKIPNRGNPENPVAGKIRSFVNEYLTDYHIRLLNLTLCPDQNPLDRPEHFNVPVVVRYPERQLLSGGGQNGLISEFVPGQTLGQILASEGNYEENNQKITSANNLYFGLIFSRVYLGDLHFDNIVLSEKDHKWYVVDCSFPVITKTEEEAAFRYFKFLPVNKDPGQIHVHARARRLLLNKMADFLRHMQYGPFAEAQKLKPGRESLKQGLDPNHMVNEGGRLVPLFHKTENMEQFVQMISSGADIFAPAFTPEGDNPSLKSFIDSRSEQKNSEASASGHMDPLQIAAYFSMVKEGRDKRLRHIGIWNNPPCYLNSDKEDYALHLSQKKLSLYHFRRDDKTWEDAGIVSDNVQSFRFLQKRTLGSDPSANSGFREGWPVLVFDHHNRFRMMSVPFREHPDDVVDLGYGPEAEDGYEIISGPHGFGHEKFLVQTSSGKLWSARIPSYGDSAISWQRIDHEGPYALMHMSGDVYGVQRLFATKDEGDQTHLSYRNYDVERDSWGPWQTLYSSDKKSFDPPLSGISVNGYEHRYEEVIMTTQSGKLYYSLSRIPEPNFRYNENGALEKINPDRPLVLEPKGYGFIDHTPMHRIAGDLFEDNIRNVPLGESSFDRKKHEEDFYSKFTPMMISADTYLFSSETDIVPMYFVRSSVYDFCRKQKETFKGLMGMKGDKREELKNQLYDAIISSFPDHREYVIRQLDDFLDDIRHDRPLEIRLQDELKKDPKLVVIATKVLLSAAMSSLPGGQLMSSVLSDYLLSHMLGGKFDHKSSLKNGIISQLSFNVGRVIPSVGGLTSMPILNSGIDAGIQGFTASSLSALGNCYDGKDFDISRFDLRDVASGTLSGALGYAIAGNADNSSRYAALKVLADTSCAAVDKLINNEKITREDITEAILIAAVSRLSHDAGVMLRDAGVMLRDAGTDFLHSLYTAPPEEITVLPPEPPSAPERFLGPMHDRNNMAEPLADSRKENKKTLPLVPESAPPPADAPELSRQPEDFSQEKHEKKDSKMPLQEGEKQHKSIKESFIAWVSSLISWSFLG